MTEGHPAPERRDPQARGLATFRDEVALERAYDRQRIARKENSGVSKRQTSDITYEMERRGLVNMILVPPQTASLSGIAPDIEALLGSKNHEISRLLGSNHLYKFVSFFVDALSAC